MPEIPEREKMDEPVCDSCAFGIEETIKREKECLKEFGWYVHSVMNDPDYPYSMNIHTHGLLENFKHPDLQICLRISPTVAHAILSGAIELIKAGRTFSDGEIVIGDIISGDLPVLFLKRQECGRDVLRIIAPDPTGCIDKENIDPYYLEQWK